MCKSTEKSGISQNLQCLHANFVIAVFFCSLTSRPLRHFMLLLAIISAISTSHLGKNQLFAVYFSHFAVGV